MPNRALSAVVGVLVHVHQVQVQEPALAGRRRAGTRSAVVDDVEVGAADGSRSDSRGGLRSGTPCVAGARVDVEALVEAEIALDPAVAPDARGAEARVAEDLGRQSWPRSRSTSSKRVTPESLRIEPGPQRRHRALRPRRLRSGGGAKRTPCDGEQIEERDWSGGCSRRCAAGSRAACRSARTGRSRPCAATSAAMSSAVPIGRGSTRRSLASLPPQQREGREQRRADHPRPGTAPEPPGREPFPAHGARL